MTPDSRDIGLCRGNSTGTVAFSTTLIDEHAERDLLGTMILAPSKTDFSEVTESLFSTQTHRDLAAAILHLRDHHIAVDPLEIQGELRRRGQDSSVAYISDLTTGVLLARPISRRVAHLAELRNRRKLVQLATELPERAEDLTEPVEQIVSWVMESLP